MPWTIVVDDLAIDEHHFDRAREPDQECGRRQLSGALAELLGGGVWRHAGEDRCQDAEAEEDRRELREVPVVFAHAVDEDDDRRREGEEDEHPRQRQGDALRELELVGVVEICDEALARVLLDPAGVAQDVMKTDDQAHAHECPSVPTPDVGGKSAMSWAMRTVKGL